MEDLDIIKQLMSGNHLEAFELKRAKELVHGLTMNLKGRVENMSDEKKHGISVRERKTNELVEFIECETGRPALRILSGIRINMGPDYKASEDYVALKEIKEIL